MSPLWFYLLLLVPSSLLAYEDFHCRRITVLWLIVLGTIAFLAAGVVSGIGKTLLCMAANTCLLVCTGAAASLCLALRGKPLRALWTEYIGAGDVAMLFAVMPLFELVSYVRFLLAASLSALGWWIVKRPDTIPLAGFMALALAGFAVCKIAGLWN